MLTLPHEDNTIVSLEEVLVFTHCCPQFLTLHFAATSERQSPCSAPTQCSSQTSTKISRPYSPLLRSSAHLILSLRCISVGTRKGYSITNCDPFGRVYTMSAYITSLGPFIGSDSYPTPPKYRRRCTRYCRDALLYVTYRSRRRCGPAIV